MQETGLSNVETQRANFSFKEFSAVVVVELRIVRFGGQFGPSGSRQRVAWGRLDVAEPIVLRNGR